MKKFFKALAVVLALTLVIGTIPASAAATIDPANVMKSKQLYLGGTKGFKTEADGTVKKSVLKQKVSYWRLLGITKEDAEELGVKATTENAKVASVDDAAMKVNGEAMGETNVTLTAGAANYTVAIIVKKSAEKVIFGEDFKDNKDRDDLKAFVSYSISIPRFEDGVKMDTDNRRLIVKNAEGTDVTADVATKVLDETDSRKDTRRWTLKFTEIGDYTITGEAFQSKKNYPGTTQTATINVKVTEGEITSIQTAYNAFKMSFSSAELAKMAKDATEPSLKEGYAAVTEDTEIIKAFQIGNAGKGDEKIAVFIKSLYLKDNELTVTTFDDLREDTTYQVEYHGYVATFKACKWVPASIGNYYAYTPNMDEKGGTAKLYTKVNAVGEQGQDVDITDKVMSMGSVDYEDGNTKNDYTKYTVAGDQVDFYVDDYSAPVKAKFTYYGADGTINKDNSFTVLAKDTRKFGVVYYDMNALTNAGDPATKREGFISADEGNKYIRVRIAVDMDGDGVYDDDYNGDGNANARSLDYLFSDNTDVTFKTSNNDKLVVEEVEGLAYAPKKANEKVGVYVYFRGQLVDGDPSTPNTKDPIYITVYDKKTLGDLEVTAKTDRKYSYSTITDDGIVYPVDEDFERFFINAKDQFGGDYSDATITVEKVTDVLDKSKDAANEVLYQEKGEWDNLPYGDANYNLTDKSAGGVAAKFDLANTKTWLYFTARSKDNGVRTVSFKVTATDNITKNKIVKTLSFTVKNTTESKVVSQAVEKVGNGYDYRVIGKDSAGYTVLGYYLDTEASVKAGSNKVYLGFYKNKNGDLMDTVEVVNGTQKTVSLLTKKPVLGGGLTKISGVTKGIVVNAGTISDTATTGGAIEVAQYATDHLAYVESTSYSARAYKRNNAGAMYVIGSSSFNFAPNNFYKVTWTWTDAYSENSAVDTVIDEAIRFTVYHWENGAHTGWTWAWVPYDAGATFSNIGTTAFTSGHDWNTWQGGDVTVSYAEKVDSISLLYIYVLDDEGVYVETPIVRSVYTNFVK